MTKNLISRRQVVAGSAAATAAVLTGPFVHTAHAAGSLNVGMWDHWVPGANKASTEVVQAWAAKEKVELTIDYIPSQGNKNLLTIAAEAQAKSGHDILAMPTWWPQAQAGTRPSARRSRPQGPAVSGSKMLPSWLTRAGV